MSDLYERYGRIVYSVVYRMIGNGGEAEEIVQEVFLRVWTRAHQIDASCGALGPWILTIARNASIDYIRTKSNRAWRFEPAYSDLMADPASLGPTISDRATEIRGAFKNLPAEQRNVIELAYFEGLSQSEISERIGRPLGTVKTWARLALGSLRRSFNVNGCQNS